MVTEWGESKPPTPKSDFSSHSNHFFWKYWKIKNGKHSEFFLKNHNFWRMSPTKFWTGGHVFPSVAKLMLRGASSHNLPQTPDHSSTTRARIITNKLSGIRQLSTYWFLYRLRIDFGVRSYQQFNCCQLLITYREGIIYHNKAQISDSPLAKLWNIASLIRLR